VERTIIGLAEANWIAEHLNGVIFGGRPLYFSSEKVSKKKFTIRINLPRNFICLKLLRNNS
jgi:hypothetical protein